MPQCCCPYIVTDAGFKNPWFRTVLSFGWDYIGRVRGTVHYEDKTEFKPIKKCDDPSAVRERKNLRVHKMLRSLTVTARIDLAEIQALLSHTWIRQPICFDLRLSEQEKRCLYLSAQGKGLKEIASFLKVSIRRITQCRQSIFQKLGCRNITGAIIIGLRYGEIRIPNLLTDSLENLEGDWPS